MFIKGGESHRTYFANEQIEIETALKNAIIVVNDLVNIQNISTALLSWRWYKSYNPTHVTGKLEEGKHWKLRADVENFDQLYFDPSNSKLRYLKIIPLWLQQQIQHKRMKIQFNDPHIDTFTGAGRESACIPRKCAVYRQLWSNWRVVWKPASGVQEFLNSRHKIAIATAKIAEFLSSPVKYYFEVFIMKRRNVSNNSYILYFTWLAKQLVLQCLLIHHF